MRGRRPLWQGAKRRKCLPQLKGVVVIHDMRRIQFVLGVNNMLFFNFGMKRIHFVNRKYVIAIEVYFNINSNAWNGFKIIQIAGI